MGFWDFLHGGAPKKSEAQLYMEKRNKEYAKRVAAYAKMEAASLATNRRTLEDDRRSAQRNAQSQYIEHNINCSTPHSVKIKNTTKTSADKFHDKVGVTDYNECRNEESIYDEPGSSLFIVENVFFKPTTMRMNISGSIKKGRFQVHDIVQLKTGENVYDMCIAAIFRQGEKIDYANVSSGKIGLLFENVKDATIKAGDKITKDKLG